MKDRSSQFLAQLSDIVSDVLTNGLHVNKSLDAAWIHLVCGGDELRHFLRDLIAGQANDCGDNFHLVRIAAACVACYAERGDHSGNADSALGTTSRSVLNSGLRHHDLNARYVAARLLAQSKPHRECIRELRHRMEFDEAPVSIAAAAALSYGRTRSLIVVKQLERGLSAHENGLALDAARALVRLSSRCPHARAAIQDTLRVDHPNCAYCLLALAEDGKRHREFATSVSELAFDTAMDTSLRGLAAATLGAIATDRDTVLHKLEPLIESHDPALIRGWANACKELGTFPERAATLLAQYLTNDNEPMLRIAALQALILMGAASLPILPMLIARAHIEPSDEVSSFLAYALSICGDDAIPRIAVELQSDNSPRAVIFGTALARMGPNGARALCELFVAEPDGFKRGVILAALREIGHDASAIVPELNGILLRERHELYIKIIVSVVEGSGSGASQAVPGLVRCLLAESEIAAAAAERALRSIGPSITTVLLDVTDYASLEQRNRLARVMQGWDLLAERRFQPLLDFNNDTELERFALAASILSRHGSASYERMAAIISTGQVDPYLTPDLSISASALRLTMSKISASLGIVVVTSEEKRPTKITPAGRELLGTVREYLRRKRVVRPIISA